MMKYLKTLFLVVALWSTHALAAESIYKIRVDGLACPYCAYGIEKKLNKIEGVTFLHMDLDKGIVTAKTNGDVVLEEKQMTQLFNDAGFTFRNMKVTAP